MRFYKTTFLLFACLLLGSTAFAQTTAPIRIVCYSTPVPEGPLYIFVFKKKTRYTMNRKVADSLINHDAIKSVKVEKGAPATAIYGSRGANGVIIIEIKKEYARKEYKRLQPYLAKF